jgi:hypothetical protein
MASIYDAFADSCSSLAAKTQRQSDKARLLQLADQWRTVTGDSQGPGKKPPPRIAAAPASDIVNRAPLLARTVDQGSVDRADMQKSVIEEIKELKAQLESKTERAKAEALEKAREAIGVLRELGVDNDTMLKDLGFRGRARAQETREGKPPKEGPCPICNFQTDPPHDGRAHRGQTKKRPLTAEELEQKGLTRV